MLANRGTTYRALLVGAADQSPAYPVQIMLGLYEFARADPPSSPDAHPEVCKVDWLRGHRLRDA